MAASGQRLIALEGMQLDVAAQYMKATQARFIKNLYYQLSDLGDAGTAQGANTGVLKPLPSNEIYCPFTLPEGNSHVIGTLPSRETNELYVFVYNSLANHFIFRINGLTATADVGAPNACFNFKLEPQFFIGEGQTYIDIIYLSDTETGRQVVKKDLYWTDGDNYQGYLRFDDYLNTNGFDPNTFIYFQGDYDRCTLLRMGLPTPNDCITIDEVPFNPVTDTGKNNNTKLTSWQFRITDIDVFGRPSEHGMISDLFFLSNNECLGASDMLSRCVNLIFPAGNPLIDKIQIEYRNCNDEQWYLDSVLELYQGSNLGEWWTRPRNPIINYDFTTNKITYTFCKDKLCDPIPTTETNRTENPLPRSSQALTKIGRNIALADNKDRFPPFPQDLLSELSTEIIKPAPSTVGDTVNVTVWIRIYNPFRFVYQKVWKKDADFVFGGMISDKKIDNIKTDYQQYFAVEGQSGYFGYLAGTNNYAIGVQYYLDSSNEFVKDTDFDGDNSKQFFLKFEYSGLPKGNYIFRLASHLANPNEDIRTTSTYVGGIYNFSNLTVGTRKTYFKELIINACSDDYDTLTAGEMLLAFDMTRPVGGAGDRVHSDDTVVDGYVFEKQNPLTMAYEMPVELLELDVLHTGGHSFEYSVITDHNGFFFAGSIGNPFVVTVKGYCSCVKKELCRVESGNIFKRYPTTMVIGSVTQTGIGGQSSCTDFDIYPCSRVLIKGKVQLCDSETGVPNINVVYSKGGTGVTDSNGDFTIIAHDNSVTGFRNDQLFVMGGSCAFTDCDGTCIDLRITSFSACTSCNERTVSAGTYKVLFVTSKGLLSGGRYGVEITGYDWLGRHGFAQTTDNLYFNVPSLNETKSFGFSTINLLIPNTITFPSWVDYITVGITVELNYGGNFIEWIADKVEFVDNSGNVNNTAPTQIKIYYGSLNEYNVKNNFNTTTGWQVTPEGTTSPRVSDIVQFIRNGDGVFFDNPITALVKYDQAGQFFLINYIDSLKDLKENALIRLANPVDCANKDSFFELCGKYKIINGKIQQSKIPLNAFDTYYQYRQIPVPVTTGTGEDAETIIELRQFGFPFEHPSITDFWGNKCANRGRFNVRNPYEAELIHLDQVALSGALSVNGQLNFLNYFDEAKKIDFNVNTTGGIVYMRVKTGLVLFVCQFRNFIVGYGDNIARLNSENIVSVPSGEDTFGKPERGYSGNFGCQLFDKSTIREIETEGQAFCQWLDRNKVAILQNDFQQTVDVSRYNKSNSTIVSWLTAKVKYQQQYNVLHGNTRYFHSSINPLNFEWLLSEFTIGSDEYVNTERQIDVTKHETISFDILNKVWKEFISPTPEYFGYLQGANEGQILFYFKNAVPYSNTGVTFNNFFGVPCERIYRFIFSTEGDKKKKFQTMAVYCNDKKYWSDVIITEAKQQSRLLKSKWKKADYFYSAAFLCDLNTNADTNIADETGINKLLDGDNLYGTWIDVRLIGDADEKYSELYSVIIFAQGIEQSGV